MHQGFRPGSRVNDVFNDARFLGLPTHCGKRFWDFQTRDRLSGSATGKYNRSRTEERKSMDQRRLERLLTSLQHAESPSVISRICLVGRDSTSVAGAGLSRVVDGRHEVLV